MNFIWYLIIGFFLLDLIILLFLVYLRFQKKISVGDLKFFQVRWIRLQSIVSQDPRFVVLEADKLFDRALGLHGYQGSLADKLRQAESRFHDVQSVWSAHKLRNLIAHEVDHTVSPAEAKRALTAFKLGLRDLDIQV